MSKDWIVRPDEISQTVRQIRVEKGMTIQQLAEKTDLDRSFLSRLERGQREWTIPTLARVMEGLGETIMAIFS